MEEYSPTVLGRQTRAPNTDLDVFPAPPKVQMVTLTSDEFTSLCPVTGQPDFQTIEISYTPRNWCVESKSLKLYLWSFRERGVFCEALSQEIAEHLQEKLNAEWVSVTILQKPRGGVGIKATSYAGPEFEKSPLNLDDFSENSNVQT